MEMTKVQFTIKYSSKTKKPLEVQCGDFPCGPVVKSLPANARDTDSIPGLGRFHMPWATKACAPQLPSPRYRAQEPQLLRPACPRASTQHQEKPLQ